MSDFRACEGETLFCDGHWDWLNYHLEKRTPQGWQQVLTVKVTNGRTHFGSIDHLYRHKTRPGELILHVNHPDNLDEEFFSSSNDGETWSILNIHQPPSSEEYDGEAL